MTPSAAYKSLSGCEGAAPPDQHINSLVLDNPIKDRGVPFLQPWVVGLFFFAAKLQELKLYFHLNADSLFNVYFYSNVWLELLQASWSSRATPSGHRRQHTAASA